MKKTIVIFALLVVFIPAIAQQVANIPICAAPGSLPFPAGPSVGTVVDAEYANATAVFQKVGEQFLQSHRIRPVARGERVAFKGEYLDANKMVALIGGRQVMLTQAWGNPVELAARSRVTLSIPSDIVPDNNGEIEVAILGNNGLQTCRGGNSPFKIKLATVVDAVYGFPLDTEHPLISGFVKVFDADGSTEITIGGQTVEQTVLDNEMIAQMLDRHQGELGEVRKNGNVVATFQIQAQTLFARQR